MRTFCKENNLSLKIFTKEDANETEGTIIKQSRPAGTYVLPGYKLEITVSKKPENVQSETESSESVE